jgi:chromosome segregation ATPase
MISQYLKTNTMKNTTFVKSTAAALMGLSLLAALPVAAQTSASVGATVNADVGVRTGKNASTSATRITNAKDRADQEIDRRITALNSLITAVQAMKRVSADTKASLNTTIQAQISDLTTLKATIDAETVLTSLTTDIKSITQSYRIFALILPQGRILAAADRAETISGDLTAVSAKLQTRITAAQTAGKDVTALQTSLADLNTKSADANTQAQAAITETASLKPDNGDATVAQSNKTTLLDARAKIKTAGQDLKTADADAKSIIKGLKAIDPSVKATVTASSSASVSQ